MYGGSTTSILLNTPGESASVMSAVEGNLMARAGRGGAALSTAAIGAVRRRHTGHGGAHSCAPMVVEVALRFGPREVLRAGRPCVRGGLRNGPCPQRGVAAERLRQPPLRAARADPDRPATGVPRLTFGIPQLLDGIDVVALPLDSSPLERCCTGPRATISIPRAYVRGSLWMSREEWARSWKAWLRGAAIGFRSARSPRGAPRFPRFSPTRLSGGWRTRSSASSVAAPSKGWRDRKPPTMRRLQAPWCRCSPSDCQPPPPQPSCWLLIPKYGLQPGPLLFQHEPRLVWN